MVITLEVDVTKWTAEQKAKELEIKEEAFNLIFLHLANSVIHKVDGMVIAFDLWNKLDSLFSAGREAVFRFEPSVCCPGIAA